MMLEFPSSPVVGQEYPAPNGTTYVWSGVHWSGISSGAAKLITTSLDAVLNNAEYTATDRVTTPLGVWNLVKKSVSPDSGNRLAVRSSGMYVDGTVTDGSATGTTVSMPGDIVYTAGTTPPIGCLRANGFAVSRVTYVELFTAIGTTFGSGDGSTTFNLPDLRGEFIRGFDDGRGADAGRVMGSAQTDLFKSHTHNTAGVGGVIPGQSGGNNTPYITSSGSVTSGSVGGTETRPRNVALLACVRYKASYGVQGIQGIPGIQGVAGTSGTTGTTGTITYSSAGTYSWTCPAGVTSVTLTGVGGGGGGGGIYTTGSSPGSAGGATTFGSLMSFTGGALGGADSVVIDGNTHNGTNGQGNILGGVGGIGNSANGGVGTIGAGGGGSTFGYGGGSGTVTVGITKTVVPGTVYTLSIGAGGTGTGGGGYQGGSGGAGSLKLDWINASSGTVTAPGLGAIGSYMFTSSMTGNIFSAGSYFTVGAGTWQAMNNSLYLQNGDGFAWYGLFQRVA